MVTKAYVEAGSRRVFACALAWPGWCRAAKDEAGALEALSSYSTRYSAVTEKAGERFAPRAGERFEVVERLKGGATTDFGAPEKVPEADHAPLAPEERRKQVSLVKAAWEVFDEVVATSPPVLRKGPRGGGRDRDAIVEHVLRAEAAYARKLGLRLETPGYDDTGEVKAFRDAIVAVWSDARSPEALVDKGWPVRYAMRRIAWHVLDHAWEIEDRSH
jgi:hypothetical protein